MRNLPARRCDSVLLGGRLAVGTGYCHDLGPRGSESGGGLIDPPIAHHPLDRPEDEEGDIDQCRQEEETEGDEESRLDGCTADGHSEHKDPGDDGHPTQPRRPGERRRAATDRQPDRADLRQRHQKRPPNTPPRPDEPNHRQRQEEHVRESGCPPAAGEDCHGTGEIVLALGHPKPAQPGRDRGQETRCEKRPDHDRRASARTRVMASGDWVGTRWPTPGNTSSSAVPPACLITRSAMFRHRHRHLVVVLSPEKQYPVPQLPQLGLISLVHHFDQDVPHHPIRRPVIGGSPSCVGSPPSDRRRPNGRG